MLVTYERVVSFGWNCAEVWAKKLSYKQRNRLFDCNPVGVSAPVIHIDFRVAAAKVPALVQLFTPLVIDQSTAAQALYPRLYPDGFECISPGGVETGAPAYIRWKEYCERAEREYITFAKTLSVPDVAEYLLPACVAHNVSVDVDAATLYIILDRVFDRFAESQYHPLRPLFRTLLEEYAPQCDTLFGTLYDRFCVHRNPEEEELEDAEMAGEGEGAGEEV